MTQPNGMEAVNAPLVDRSAIDPIMKVTGVAVMRRIVDVFWNTRDEMVGDLRAALHSGDPETFRRAAHTLKGAASNVGAGRAARIAAVMEKTPPADAMPMLSALEKALEDTRPALDDLLRSAA